MAEKIGWNRSHNNIFDKCRLLSWICNTTRGEWVVKCSLLWSLRRRPRFPDSGQNTTYRLLGLWNVKIHETFSTSSQNLSSRWNSEWRRPNWSTKLLRFSLDFFLIAISDSSLFCNSQERSMPTFAEIYASGAVAGFVALGLSIPIELVKTKLQSQMKRRMFSGPVHCVTTIFRDRGIRGLYRGGVPTAIRNVICAAVRFSMLCGYLSVCEADLFPANSWQVFTASAIAGVTSWFVVIPFDTIKSRIQADDHRRPKYHGMIHCAVEILKRDGVIGLYRGLWSASLRVLPVVSVNFAAMEVITSQLCRRGRT